MNYPAGCPLDEVPATVVVSKAGGTTTMHAPSEGRLEAEPRCGHAGDFRQVDRAAVEPTHEPCDTCFSTS